MSFAFQDDDGLGQKAAILERMQRLGQGAPSQFGSCISMSYPFPNTATLIRDGNQNQFNQNGNQGNQFGGAQNQFNNPGNFSGNNQYGQPQGQFNGSQGQFNNPQGPQGESAGTNACRFIKKMSLCSLHCRVQPVWTAAATAATAVRQ